MIKTTSIETKKPSEIDQKDKEDEFLKQLLNWEDNPNALLNTLKAMKGEQMNMQDGQEEMIEEKNPGDFDDEEDEKMNDSGNQDMLDELFGKDLLNNMQKPQDIPQDLQGLDKNIQG